MSRKDASTATDSAVPDSPYEAFRQLVYGFGVKELAALMGLKPGSLYNKADADMESQAQPTLRDLMLATRLAGDTSVLESLDRMFDRTGLELGPLTDVSDEALLELLLKVGSEHGEMCQAAHAAMQSQRISAHQVRAVRGEAFDLVRAVLAFVKRLEGLIDE